MKHIYILLALISTISATSQTIYIPDAALKLRLTTQAIALGVAQNAQGDNMYIDTNLDGEIQISEATLVYSLSLSNSGIANAQGLQYFVNLRSLDISNNWINSLNASPLSSLKTLKCHNAGLQNLTVSGLSSLETLECYSNQLTNLDLTGLSALKNLVAYANQLNSISFSGLSNLEQILIGDNPIPNFDLNGLSALKTLSITNNGVLTALDLSPAASLEQVSIVCYNLLTLDLSGLSQLSRLELMMTSVTSLDLSGLVGLEHLYCPDNQLSHLDLSGLPALMTVNCENNLLQEITFGDSAPGIVHLNCSGNQLPSLDLNGFESLSVLRCYNNLLTSLDLSGTPMLTNLDCNNNQIQILDANNCKNLEWLIANFNDLTALMVKNGKEETVLDFQGNHDLTFICIDESQQAYLENRFNYYLVLFGETFDYAAQCVVNSYCSFVPGGSVHYVNGQSRVDVDADGCSAADIAYPHLRFDVTDGTVAGSFTADGSGNYSLPLAETIHEITPVIVENPGFFTVSPSSFSVNFPLDGLSVTQDVCIQPNGSHQDVEVVLIPVDPARPGFDATYRLLYRNKGTIAMSGDVKLTFPDELADFISAVPSATALAGPDISWSYANLQPLESREIDIVLNVNSPSDVPAVNVGAQLDFFARIQPFEGDELPLDNGSGLKQIVVGAIDPNDKTCLEGEIINPDSAGQYVHYLIRFENTGNYPAENIVVLDVIDAQKFQLESLVPLTSSHLFRIERVDNRVEFIFENVNLGFEDDGNDGFVAFKIRTNPNLVNGDSFGNAASIFFDYNLPVVTEPATTVLQALNAGGVSAIGNFRLYPNPANSSISIDPIASIEIRSVEIYDALGNRVVSVPNFRSGQNIDVTRLKTGVYFVNVTSEKGNSSAKFVKE